MRVTQEGPESLPDYEGVSIVFETSSRLDLADLRKGIFTEAPIPQRRKDYDEITSERPSSLAHRFDPAPWGIFAGFDGEIRLGGTIVIRNTPEYELLEQRHDLAIIADLRVLPEFRGLGFGSALVTQAVDWARAQGCAEIRVETQDINVTACRFYDAMGFHLHSIEEQVYGPDIDETRILWARKLV